MSVEAQRVQDEAQLDSESPGSSKDRKKEGSPGVVLQSPTSVTPVEGAAIFSMPRTEVGMPSGSLIFPLSHLLLPLKESMGLKLARIQFE